MAFLGQGVTNKPVYPGVALFVVPGSLERGYDMDMARDFGVCAIMYVYMYIANST